MEHQQRSINNAPTISSELRNQEGEMKGGPWTPSDHIDNIFMRATSSTFEKQATPTASSCYDLEHQSQQPALIQKV